MNIDIKTISSKLSIIKDFIARYAVIIFVVTVVTIAGFLTLQIAQLSNIEPTEGQQDEKLASIKSVRLDAASIEKIKQLEDQNISVESLFNNGRANPFE